MGVVVVKFDLKAIPVRSDLAERGISLGANPDIIERGSIDYNAACDVFLFLGIVQKVLPVILVYDNIDAMHHIGVEQLLHIGHLCPADRDSQLIRIYKDNGRQQRERNEDPAHHIGIWMLCHSFTPIPYSLRCN